MTESMGNAPSRRTRQPQQHWNWEFKNGRADIVPKKKTHQPKKPLFKKQVSNNYNWWIFNPDQPKKRSAKK